MGVDAGHLLDNRYRLGRQVGSGGMATVYAATDVRLERAVAVKLFHPGADDIALARLEAEARLLARLSHPGLLRVFDASTAAGRPYLVMQLINGCTLRTVINCSPTAPEAVARLGARLAETLRYVHSRQIVHRDLKPSNVLLDGSGSCYLADFGIARALGAARLTGAGNCVGTAAYLAPEQVAGEAVGPPADIYSLGLVLLECLTGRPEYTGSEVEAAVARLSRPPGIPDGVPPGLGRTLAAMTARDPADRPDAGMCAELLANCSTGATAPVLPPVADQPSAPDKLTKVQEIEPVRPLHRRSRVVRAASAVVVATGVTLGTLLWNDVAVPVRPAEPASPPAEPRTVPAADLVPRTAVSQVEVAPEPERRSAVEHAKNDDDDKDDDKDDDNGGRKRGGRG